MQNKNKKYVKPTKPISNVVEKQIPRRRDKRDRDNYYDESPKGKFKDDEYDEEYEVEYDA